MLRLQPGRLPRQRTQGQGAGRGRRDLKRADIEALLNEGRAIAERLLLFAEDESAGDLSEAIADLDEWVVRAAEAVPHLSGIGANG